jgi:hypothetical protein
VEAAASQAAVDAALDQATAEAEAQGEVPVEGAAGYEEPFAPPATDELPADFAAGLEAIAEGRTPEEAAAARAAAQQALRGSDSHTQAAMDMFQGAQTPSGRFALPGGGEFDDFVLLSDEEAPSPLRWVGVGVGVLLVLLAGTTLFVLARNDWKIDFGRLWDQVKHAFGAGATVTDERACLAASVRIPALVRASDGAVVIVRGTINNFCDHSVSRASIRCKLEGRGGSWTDTARPFRDSGASDLSEEDLDGKSTLGVTRAIEDEENPSGVVLPGVTHEFWCAFPAAADAKSKASQFTPTFEVAVP